MTYARMSHIHVDIGQRFVSLNAGAALSLTPDGNCLRKGRIRRPLLFTEKPEPAHQIDRRDRHREPPAPDAKSGIAHAQQHRRGDDVPMIDNPMAPTYAHQGMLMSKAKSNEPK